MSRDTKGGTNEKEKIKKVTPKKTEGTESVLGRWRK